MPEPEKAANKPKERESGLGDCFAEGLVEGCAGCLGGLVMLCILVLAGITLWASSRH